MNHQAMAGRTAPRTRGRTSALWVAALAFSLTHAVCAQNFRPRIGYSFPAGGRQGATFQVVVGGQNLVGATNVYFSGRGLRAEVLEYNRPLTQKEFNDLRERMQELQKNKKDSGAQKELAEIRARIAKNPPNRQGNPAIAETVTLRVTLVTNAEPGRQEIRLGTPNGLSNPLVFCVGQLPEYSAPPAKGVNPDLERYRAKFGREAPASTAGTETRITIPVTLNGQIMPGKHDRYRFAARRGTHLVVAASARALIPYLPDAVPGWFQATLALYDAKGRELAYDDDFRFNPDPALYYEIQSDGDYVIEIKDAIYRGREDFVYRVSIGELPFVTSVFPLGGPAGSPTSVEVKGWNLPVNRFNPATDGPGLSEVALGSRELFPTPFAVDTLPEVLEQEPNDSPAHAQKITLPVIINGRIGAPKDIDVFLFDGRAGGEIVAEVMARRLNSPLDSVLRLTDAAGQLLAMNDDHEDKGSGLTTHHADSYLRCVLPANGTYRLVLADTQGKGGPEYAYRLRVSPPQPDFELRVVPSSLTVRGGGTVPFTVFAMRKDGFTNAISLALKDAPAGFALSGARVPPNQDQVRLTLTVSPSPQSQPVDLHIEGRATIGARQVVHAALPAEDMMQAFAYRHLVTARQFKVAVAGRWTQKFAAHILANGPVQIPAGGTARVRLNVPARAFGEKFHLELSDPPEGITLQDVIPSGLGAEIVLQCDAAKVKPGLEGNLIVQTFAAKTSAPAKPAKAADKRRTPLGALPAIPFEIVRK